MFEVQQVCSNEIKKRLAISLTASPVYINLQNINLLVFIKFEM